MPAAIMIKTEVVDVIKQNLKEALKLEPTTKAMSVVVSENAEVIRKLRAKGYSFEAIAEIFNKALKSENQNLKPASLKALFSKKEKSKKEKSKDNGAGKKNSTISFKEE